MTCCPWLIVKILEDVSTQGGAVDRDHRWCEFLPKGEEFIISEEETSQTCPNDDETAKTTSFDVPQHSMGGSDRRRGIIGCVNDTSRAPVALGKVKAMVSVARSGKMLPEKQVATRRAGGTRRTSA
jgi:hypothetical protein